MLRIAILLLVGFNLCFDLNGQNGPGGVGTSANNVLWLDANRGVTVSSGSVTAWADQSGNAFSAAPSAVVARPTFSASSANGYPVIDFDGTNDELWINDNAAFDVTQWHMFIIPYVKVQKDYNAWFTKGNDGNENFEMLSFSDGNMHNPTYYTDATRTFPSSAGSQVSSTVNILEYSYSASVGRDVYKNNNSITTDNESKTPANNNFSVYIGNEKNTTGRFINGGLAEVIMYNAPLNSAQRIIVNNYLAAKYNCTLTANDIYVQDNPANGNFDHDVAGIGRVNSSNVHNDSRGSGIVRILNPSGLDDGEYYFWGHNNGALGTYQTGDYPSGQGLQGRLVRVWRGTEQGSITNFEVRFDLTGLGSVTASQLRLLIDTNNDGAFADETAAGGGVIGSAVTLGSNVYGFTNVTGLNNNIRFTLGTTNLASTPLPVELNEFSAVKADNRVVLNWSTLSEKNNKEFLIERSGNGIEFETIGALAGALNSKEKRNYQYTDNAPLVGLAYYRLKQKDVSGDFTFSDIVLVNEMHSAISGFITPNPTNGNFEVNLKSFKGMATTISIRDNNGRECYKQVPEPQELQTGKVQVNCGKLSAGNYVVIVTSNDEIYTQKLIIK